MRSGTRCDRSADSPYPTTKPFELLRRRETFCHVRTQAFRRIAFKKGFFGHVETIPCTVRSGMLGGRDNFSSVLTKRSYTATMQEFTSLFPSDF